MTQLKHPAVAAFLIATCFACDLSVSTTTTFYSSASLDGEVNSLGTYNTASEEMNVGDLSNHSTNRGFVSFDISSITPDAGKELTIESAVFRIYMVDWFGYPYSLGNTLVELVDYGSGLTAADYSTAAIDYCGALSSSTGMVVERTLDVTQVIADYIDSGAADRFRPQFRLRQATTTNNDSTTDETEWYTGDFTFEEYQPRLVIQYNIE